MADDLDSVKTTGAFKQGYHHGDLRASLVTAALGIVEEVGPDAFSLRAAARRAGVSPAAPAHHFGDARGLLTAIATVGFRDLGNDLESASGSDRRSIIAAQCHAYLRFALARPGLFRLMWRRSALDVENADYISAARRAFSISDQIVRPGNPPAASSAGDAAIAPTIACWAMVHGFVALVIDGAFFAQETGTSGALDVLLDATLHHLRLE